MPSVSATSLNLPNTEPEKLVIIYKSSLSLHKENDDGHITIAIFLINLFA
jgi:hypothetical protein